MLKLVGNAFPPRGQIMLKKSILTNFIGLTTALTLGLSLSGTSLAKTFFDYCMQPENEAQRQTVLAVMIKLRVWEHPDEKNCRQTAELLRQRSYLNIYPDPFEAARGAASDIHPIEEEVQLRDLSLSKNEIIDLSPIKKFTNLVRLNIYNNPVSDISVIAQFKRLKELTASNTNIRDLSPLTGLDSLTTLSVSNAADSQLTPLAKLKNLRTIILGFNQIEDTTPLNGLVLEYLQLEKNKITALDVSSSKSTMTMLDVNGNQLSSVNGLSQLEIIDAVNIAHNQFDNLKDFSGLKTLRWLNIRDNKITDLAPLGQLTDLQYLMLDGNQICNIPDSIKALESEHLNSKDEWIHLEISGVDQQSGCTKP